MKQKIKIFFTDFWSNFEIFNNPFYNTLSKKYDVEVTDDSPDLLFFSVFGTKYKNFNTKRIFYTGENVRPNFKTCDFAFTFDYIDDTRHYRLPLYPFFADVNLLLKEKNIEEILKEKTKFCNFIYSNPNQKIRNRFFKKLSKYKTVDSGGRYLNNIGGPINNKLDFIKNYKFTIAFENNSYPGYTTEKIFEPMLVNSIPIYWGNEFIGRDFNTNSFLNYHDFESEDALIDKIIEIDKNEELFIEFLKQPYFKDNKVNEFVDSKNILNFLEKVISSNVMPIANKSIVFSHHKVLSHFGRFAIDFNFHLKRYLNKIKNFRIIKIKYKFEKLKKLDN